MADRLRISCVTFEIPKNERLENIRLSIDIQCLKQMRWETVGGTSLDELLPEDAAENAIRWIDTSCMIVDSLTKKMKPDILLSTIQTGRFTLIPTAESEVLKMKKRKQRAKAKGEGKEDAG